MATIFLYNWLFSHIHLHLSWHVAYTWLWRRCFLLGFTKAIVLHLLGYDLFPSGAAAFCEISPEPSSIPFALLSCGWFIELVALLHVFDYVLDV